MKAIKKTISVVLAVMMILCTFSALSFSVSAAEENKITVTSNLCKEASYTYNANSKQVTVTYYLQADNMIIDAQAICTYDSSVLKVASTNKRDTCMPVLKEGNSFVNFKDGRILFNGTNLNLYNFKSKGVFFTVTFDIIGSGSTNVNLDVQVLSASLANSYEELDGSDDIDLVYLDKVATEGFEFTSEAKVIGEEPVPGDVTLYAAAPVFKEGNTWDDIYLAYSSNSNVSKATKIAMTKTDNYFYASGTLAGSLSTNSNWAVYSVTLTKEQAAAIDAVNYAGFVNSYNSVMTSYIWANSIFRANIDSSGYKTAKTSVADLDGKMFVINGATTLDNKKGFTGNWVSNEGSKKLSTIYAASPIVNDTTTMGDMYFRYGTTSNVASAKQIRMMKTDDLYNCTNPQGTQLKAGQWAVYKLDLTEEQAAEIDKCNYTGFTSAYGAEIRTQFAYASSVTRANVGTSGYKSAKTPIADLDGKMFFITSSAADNTITYLGNWGEYGGQVKTATIKVAVPTTVGTKAVKDLNLVYSDSSDIKEATFLKMTATDETFTPDATHTSLIANNAKWTVYTITIDADQIKEIQKVKRCGFSTSDRSVRTGFSWSYNVLRAGVGEYENPFDTTTTARFYDVDGMTFVMNGAVIDTNPTTMIGYWK